jgi:hypothetical protein
VVIGLFMHPEMNENFIARFRQKLTIPDQVKTVVIDPENFQKIKSLIYQMTEVQPEEMNI